MVEQPEDEALPSQPGERRNPQTHRRLRETNFARAQEIAHLGSWQWDLVRNAVVWSDELFRIFGIDPATFVPSREATVSLIHPDDRSIHEDAVAAALAGTSVPPFQWRLLRPDGEERFVLASGFAVDRDASGNVLALFAAVQDITDRIRMQRSLESTRAELRRLVEAQEHAREAERVRIARELHDDMQQQLTGIILEARVARVGSGQRDGGCDGALMQIERLAKDAMQATRRIINDLRPKLLDELGLEKALKLLAVQFTERSGVRCELEHSGLEFESERATSIFRITQEALNNVSKHARAKQARISISNAADGVVHLEVVDDGVGMASAARGEGRGFGLMGIRERVQAVGGSLRIVSRPACGTGLFVDLPSPGSPGPAARDVLA